MSKPELPGVIRASVVDAWHLGQRGCGMVMMLRLGSGGSATLSVTDKCRYGAVMGPAWNLSSAAAGQYCSLLHFKISYPQYNPSRKVLILQTSCRRRTPRFTLDTMDGSICDGPGGGKQAA